MSTATTARSGACCLGMLLVFVSSSFAQSGRNVAVVINENSAASVQIGEYYAKARSLPAENVIRIKATAVEEISRQDYSNSIETPIGDALSRHQTQDRVLYIVLTKGVPLRIAGSAGPSGTAASVDSELTLLYRRMAGRPVPVAGFIENPFYLGSLSVSAAKPFSHRSHDIYLVTRLDAFTVQEAMALVDRATAPSTLGAIVLDGRAEPAAAIADRWTAEAAQVVRTVQPERRVLLDRQAAVGTEEVIGYYSAGSRRSSDAGRTSGLKFSAGAVAAALVSTDARTFQEPPATWLPRDGSAGRSQHFGGSAQSLVADLIRDGVTGAAGNISEPYLQSALRPQVLFPAYLGGVNLVEAFYLALPHLGWQSVVIGDPLCAPFPRDPRTAADAEPPIDPDTELPSFFSKARLENARPSMKALPPQARSLIVRAEARSRRGDTAGARKSLEEAVELAPTATPAQLQLALMHEQAGELEQSLARYRAALKNDPNNVVALNNLAYSVAVRQGAPRDALPIARRALTLSPASPTVIDTVAWIEHLLGNDTEAARLLAPAVQKPTGNAEIHFHAAVVFAALGRREAAEAQLKEMLSLDPRLVDRDDVKSLRASLATKK